MRPFAYHAAETLDEALAALRAEPGAVALAGGTTLVDLLKAGLAAPPAVIDISRLPLAEIALRADGSVRIGALARNADVAADATVATHFPAVSQALLAGASPQLRNMATVGGNLLQRTRCSYFWDAAARCNRRVPGSGCDALEGYNRSHALLGTSAACIAAHPSDLCVALAALDARVAIAGAAGERTIPFAALYPLPGDHPEREHGLAPDELIVAVELAPSAAAARSCYLKLRDRASYEFALVSAAAGLEIAGGTIRAARIGLGGVATVPWRSHAAEAVLTGAAPDAAAFAAAAEAALADAVPRRHNGFKAELARRAIVRALRTVAA